MSRIHDALRKSEMENRQAAITEPEPVPPANSRSRAVAPPLGLDSCRIVNAGISPNVHLVALADPLSLAAEKFRVLSTRLDNMRSVTQLRSLQVCSGAVNDGKTLTAGNLAVTLASRSASKVLLIEGDLHKPALAQLFGLDKQSGLTHWWSEPEADITQSIQRLEGMPLWMLTAGNVYGQPSDIWRSARFANVFKEFTRSFDWIVVDSTPLLPTVDANLWSRLVDGTLLVVREGVTPVETLKRGLQSLDNPKIIGVVLNEASEFDNVNAYDRYYAEPRNGNNVHRKGKSLEGIA